MTAGFARLAAAPSQAHYPRATILQVVPRAPVWLVKRFHPDMFIQSTHGGVAALKCANQIVADAWPRCAIRFGMSGHMSAGRAGPRAMRGRSIVVAEAGRSRGADIPDPNGSVCGPRTKHASSVRSRISPRLRSGVHDPLDLWCDPVDGPFMDSTEHGGCTPAPDGPRATAKGARASAWERGNQAAAAAATTVWVGSPVGKATSSCCSIHVYTRIRPRTGRPGSVGRVAPTR
jgi:hypothetical protein